METCKGYRLLVGSGDWTICVEKKTYRFHMIQSLKRRHERETRMTVIVCLLCWFGWSWVVSCCRCCQMRRKEKGRGMGIVSEFVCIWVRLEWKIALQRVCDEWKWMRSFRVWTGDRIVFVIYLWEYIQTINIKPEWERITITLPFTSNTLHMPPQQQPHTIPTKTTTPLLISPLPHHAQITVLPASSFCSFSLHRTNLHCFLLLVRVSIRINSTMLTLDVDPLRYLSKSRDGMVYWQCCGRLSRRRQACAKQRRIVDGARFSSWPCRQLFVCHGSNIRVYDVNGIQLVNTLVCAHSSATHRIGRSQEQSHRLLS